MAYVIPYTIWRDSAASLGRGVKLTMSMTRSIPSGSVCWKRRNVREIHLERHCSSFQWTYRSTSVPHIHVEKESITNVKFAVLVGNLEAFLITNVFQARFRAIMSSRTGRRNPHGLCEILQSDKDTQSRREGMGKATRRSIGDCVIMIMLVARAKLGSNDLRKKRVSEKRKGPPVTFTSITYRELNHRRIGTQDCFDSFGEQFVVTQVLQDLVDAGLLGAKIERVTVLFAHHPDILFRAESLTFQINVIAESSRILGLDHARDHGESVLHHNVGAFFGRAVGWQK
jgi:hypothetical protein